MKLKILFLLLVSLIAGNAYAQTWINGGNGLQYYDAAGFRNYRHVLTYPQPAFSITDSLKKKLNLTGGMMSGDINFKGLGNVGSVNTNSGNGILFNKNSDNSKIYFESTSDIAGDSNLIFENGDNINSAGGPTEGFVFRKYDLINNPSVIDLLRINLTQFKYKTFDIYHKGNLTSLKSDLLVAQPLGLATLDANGNIPLSQINASLLGAVNYQGTYNAGTNTPALATPSSANKGWYYIVSAPGTQVGLSLALNDWIISNGTAWGKVDNNNSVTSVAGRTGAVVLNSGDVGLGAVNNTSDANKPVSTATQTALNGKWNLSGGNTATGTQTLTSGGFVSQGGFSFTSGKEWATISSIGGKGGSLQTSGALTLIGRLNSDQNIGYKTNIFASGTNTADVNIYAPSVDGELVVASMLPTNTTFVDLGSAQNISGAKNFLSAISGTALNLTNASISTLGAANFSSNLTVGGTANFTGQANGITPTGASSFTTKGYVDGLIAIGQTIGANTTGNAATATLAANSTQWSGRIWQGASTGSDIYFMTSPDAGNWKYSTISQSRVMLGMPSGGENLTSITARGNSTPSSVIIGNLSITNTGIASFVPSPTLPFNIQGTKAGIGAGDITLQTSGGNVGIGTTTPGAKLEVNGNAIVATPTATNHAATKGYTDDKITGGTIAPTISLGAATTVGAGATISIAGNNIDGVITLVTGTSITTGGVVFTVTMGGGFSYPVSCAPILQVNTVGSTQNQGLSINNQTTTTWSAYTGAIPAYIGLAPSTTYKWNYHNGGY